LEELRWPPRREDLLRLYVGKKLSAAKIAASYGLKHPNPKSSETLVLYHLKKFGIKRRDCADHVRKVTEETAKEWVARYESGESLKQIAGLRTSPVTVWNHLKKRGLVLRDKVDAQIKAVTKYERLPFGGDKLEKAYMIGLRCGDLHVVRHGRAVRVRVSTTHPAMAQLFEDLFSAYGHISKYARTAKLTGYEWSLECDLHISFEFLLVKPKMGVLEVFTDEEFVAFLAGVFDAEGSVYLHKKLMRHNPEMCISNSEAELVDFLSGRLRSQGYHASIRWIEQEPDRRGVVGHSRMGRVEIVRFLEVQRLLRALPIRHSEKMAKRDLALALEYRSSRDHATEIVARWKALSSLIRTQTKDYVRFANEWIERRKVKKSGLLSRGGMEESKTSFVENSEPESGSNGRSPQAKNSIPNI